MEPNGKEARRSTAKAAGQADANPIGASRTSEAGHEAGTTTTPKRASSRLDASYAAEAGGTASASPSGNGIAFGEGQGTAFAAGLSLAVGRVNT